ncbi:hypothetical protein [Dactylosporangium sp. CA-233914]
MKDLLAKRYGDRGAATLDVSLAAILLGITLVAAVTLVGGAW